MKKVPKSFCQDDFIMKVNICEQGTGGGGGLVESVGVMLFFMTIDDSQIQSAVKDDQSALNWLKNHCDVDEIALSQQRTRKIAGNQDILQKIKNVERKKITERIDDILINRRSLAQAVHARTAWHFGEDRPSSF